MTSHQQTYQMSQDNPELQTRLADPTKPEVHLEEDVMDQIQELKKVILNLERRQIIKSRPKQGSEPDGNQQLKQRMGRNRGSSSRLAFGNQIKQEINLSFRTRHLNQNNKGNSNHPNSIVEKEQEDKSIIDAFKAEGSCLVSERPDSEEEEPVRTQLHTPAPRQRNVESSEFHFRKLDLIPSIEEENSKFYSYMKSYREKKAASLHNRFKREPPSTATSQPEFQNMKSSPRPPHIVDQFLDIKLNKNSSKEEIVETGEKIFKHFLVNQEEPNFTIKKYKNCLVFSLMPQQTKAAIWYYTRELYFGNISLNEEGRVERNGNGAEWVQGRHFYQGQFISGQKNGRGKISYQNGDEYEGQWLEGQIYGFGRFTDSKKQKKYEGFWRNGQFCGQAPKDVFEWANG